MLLATGRDRPHSDTRTMLSVGNSTEKATLLLGFIATTDPSFAQRQTTMHRKELSTRMKALRLHLECWQTSLDM